MNGPATDATSRILNINEPIYTFGDSIDFVVTFGFNWSVVSYPCPVYVWMTGMYGHPSHMYTSE